MTSVDCATHLVDECQVKRRKGDLLLTKEPSTEENCCPEEQFKKQFETDFSPLRSLKLPSIFAVLIIIQFLCYC